MTQITDNYARVLYDLAIPKDKVQESKSLLESIPELKEVLCNPVISHANKNSVIEQVFPREMVNFLKVVSDYNSMDCIENIFKAYEEYCNKQENRIEATLYYVVPPTEEQEKKMKEFLCNKYHKKEAALKLVKNEDLIGGFVLRAGNQEFDQSVLGRIKQLQRQLIRR